MIRVLIYEQKMMFFVLPMLAKSLRSKFTERSKLLGFGSTERNKLLSFGSTERNKVTDS